MNDIEAVVADHKGNGVFFEEYDFDELKTVNGIAALPDGLKAAWKDLGVFQDVRPGRTVPAGHTPLARAQDDSQRR